MKKIYVFRNRKKDVREPGFKGLYASIKYGETADLSVDDIITLSIGNKFFYLVQGYDIVGIAFDSETANRGLRILAHQQYLGGNNTPYSIEVYKNSDLKINTHCSENFKLSYVNMYD